MPYSCSKYNPKNWIFGGNPLTEDGGVEWPGTSGDSNTGDDIVHGGDGNDTIYGGAGMDTLMGMDGDDMLMGGDGDDMLTGGAGNDTFKFDAADGEDTITDFQQGDMIMLGDAAISMSEAQGVIASRMPVSGGHQYTWGTTKFTVLDDPLAMSDLVYEEPAPEPTRLTSGNDTWGSATEGATDYNGDDDYVNGGRGADSITGGAGNDTLEGDAGNDTLVGGEGDDVLTGGTGLDQYNGGAGDDVIHADLADIGVGSALTGASIVGGDDDDTLSFASSSLRLAGCRQRSNFLDCTLSTNMA